jgi:tetratricopeptide (TPR) repeat protein
MWTENEELKEKISEQEEGINKKTSKLYETIEQTTKEMNEKLKEVEYNTELAIAINKSKNKDKIEELKKLVEKYPKKTKVYFQLGSFLIDEKNYEEAISNFNIIKKLEPKNGGSYNIIGLGYEIWGLNEKKKKNNIGAKKYFEEAIKNYELAMKLNPNKKTYVTNKKLAKKRLKELEDK